MARSDITVQQLPGSAGTKPTYEAANVDGNAFANTGKETLHVKNDGAGSVTVTAVTAGDIHGLAIADLALVLAAGEEGFINALDTKAFNQPSGADAGKVYIDYSGVTSVSVAVLRP